TANAHVDCGWRAQHLRGHVAYTADDLVAGVGEIWLEAAQRAPRHARDVREGGVELCLQRGRSDTDGQPDARLGDRVRRHEVGENAAAYGADVDGDAGEGGRFAGARELLGDGSGGGDGARDSSGSIDG